MRKDPVQVAGLKSNNGFLSEQEREMILQGKMHCAHRNIPALGPRADEVVRSYELSVMVRWIVPADRWLNKHVSLFVVAILYRLSYSYHVSIVLPMETNQAVNASG